jgi:Flp pilus assembly protein TadD
LSLALMEEGRRRDCGESSTPGTNKTISQSNCQAWYQALAHTELEQARELIDAALLAEPHRAEYLDTLAVVLEAQGEMDGARRAAHQAAQIVPDDVYLLWQAYRLDEAARLPQGG